MLTGTVANYKFLIVDISSYSNDSDGGMFAASALSEQLESKTYPLLPTPPHVIIA